MSDRVRIGIIGCGQIAQQHMASYSKIPEAEMVIFADLNEQAAKTSAEKYGASAWTTNFRDILSRDDIDAVDVCLHNNFHMPVTVEALQAGKNVYCEKPMAGSYRDAAAMLQTAKETGKKLHIQLGTLYSNETRAAQELIQLGELGKLYHARSTGVRRRGRPYVDGYGTPTFVQKRNSAGGALYDMGVYHISQVLFLLGNPQVERICGRTYQEIEMDMARREKSGYDVEEMGLGLIRLSDKMSLDLIETWASHIDRMDGSMIFGSKGGVRLNPFGFFTSMGHLDLNATVDLGSAAFRWSNVAEDHGYFSDSQTHWVAALQGKVGLLPTAEIALNTMLISEGIYMSEREGQEVTAKEVADSSVSSAVKV